MKTILLLIVTMLVCMPAIAQEQDPPPMATMLLPLPDRMPEVGEGWKKPWEVVGLTRSEWTSVPTPGSAAFRMMLELQNTTDEDFAEAWPALKQLFGGFAGKGAEKMTRTDLIAKLEALDKGLEDSAAEEYMRNMPDPARPGYDLGFTDNMVMTSAIYRSDYMEKEQANLDLPATDRVATANQIRDQKLAQKKAGEEQAAQRLKDYEQLEEEYALYVRSYEQSKTDGSSEETVKTMGDRMKAARQRADYVLKEIETVLAYSPEVACEGINGVDSGYLVVIDEEGTIRKVTVKARVRVGRAILDVSREAQGPYAQKAAEQTRALLKRLSTDLAPFAKR